MKNQTTTDRGARSDAARETNLAQSPQAAANQDGELDDRQLESVSGGNAAFYINGRTSPPAWRPPARRR